MHTHAHARDTWHAAARDEAVSFRVQVTNVGPVAGDEVVLAFVTRDNADRGPLKQLFAFERVHLNPGTRSPAHA
jgi:hypothetical protein